MSKAIILITLVAVLTSTILLPGCTTNGLGGIVTEEKDLTDFTYVAVEGTFDIEIVQSESFSVSVSADESFYDYVAVSKTGNTLRIYLNPRHTFTDFTLQARTLKAKITMPALHGVHLSGASKGTVTGFKSSEDFSLEVSGASSLNIDDSEVGDAEFKISGASKVTGSMNADDVKFEVSGASKVDLDGSASNFFLTASGASKVDLTDFPLNNANAKLSGASEASINVKGRLDAVVSAASSIYFLGNPTMGNISVTGASTIKHK
ncbi:head GIN domain-containing protein [Chloroflexota bacterium]